MRVDVRRLEARGLARAKARSRRLRASRMRKLVFRGSLALFAVLWAVIFVQLASGNDPALSKTAKAPPARHQKPHHPPPAEADPSVTAVEPEPEAEFEAEPEPEPAPEPVVTSSS